MRRDLHAAIAGAAAAAAWIAVEPVTRRLAHGTHRELRLISGLLAGDRGGDRLGLAVHLANGAAFGVAFRRLGGHGVRRAILAAQAENALLWPGMAVADRIHPDVRSGAWPRLFPDPGTIAQEVGGHMIFGVVLGLLLRDPA
ncbi:MAG TPA: hypothetical protein VLB81_03660 [Gaiellales bacterium]|nr:hypothetical protein [Gaiellales bacterium]